jgi:hypothetical protein
MTQAYFVYDQSPFLFEENMLFEPFSVGATFLPARAGSKRQFFKRLLAVKKENGWTPKRHRRHSI